MTDDWRPATFGNYLVHADAHGVSGDDRNPGYLLTRTCLGDEVLGAISWLQAGGIECPTDRGFIFGCGSREHRNARGRLLATGEHQHRADSQGSRERPSWPATKFHESDITGRIVGRPAAVQLEAVVHNHRVTTSTLKEDTVLKDARGIAHDAVVDDVGPAIVGAYVGFAMDDERVGTHSFECADPGYVGWRWAVSVARAPRAKVATVCEIVLLPGPDSLLAPAWVPWSERILPGDLGVGDVLPTPANDERLVLGVSGNDELDGIVDRDEPRGWTGWEAGLGRARVLSFTGRDGAAERWDGGDFGPLAPMAEAAPKPCATCGFLIHVAGPLARAFGVCANEFAPADGRLVSLAYGCGAHSEVVEPTAD